MLRFGSVLFDPATRRVMRGGEEQRLSLKAAAVLLALAETPHQVWSRGALLERVWPEVHVGEEVLTNAVAQIRRALGDDFRAPRILQTVPKSGYRLMCAPERAFEFGEHERTQPDEDEIGLSALSDYLIGCERFERGGRLSTLEAIDRFERAAKAAPRFALVHAGLGKAMAFLSLYYEARSGQLELARRHCEIAHRIASPSPEAYAAEGLIFAASGDTARSARCFSAALAHRPQYSDTYYLLGRACLSELDFEIGAMVLERAALLRQDDFHSLFLAGKMRLGQGDEAGARADFALAEPRAQQVLALQPQHLRALCVQARCLLEMGAHDRAHALLDELSAHPDPMNYQVACSYARAGDGDRALDILEEVVEFGWRHGAWLARDPDFARFRDHPRFRRTAASIATASHIT